MGALRRVRVRSGLLAVALAGAVGVGLVACEPGDGMSSIAVALTTDQTGTKALERKGFDVQWMSCTATMGEGGKVTANSSDGPSKSPSVRSVATVDCEGETKDGRDITLKGKVTEERQGRCVRGDLTAKVDGKVVLEASLLGNCSGTEPSRPEPSQPGPSGPEPSNPGPTPPDDPRPTVTVTVTADPPPTCDCSPGK
ncbi:hypothetical protein ACFQVC_15445 [Streptomyces monticola]|uniref:Lipoprotein n=1 Tax=Streptomyces monticola TaxID=2666263 RepID=A0ABW2JIQ9_9ACTN